MLKHVNQVMHFVTLLLYSTFCYHFGKLVVMWSNFSLGNNDDFSGSYREREREEFELKWKVKKEIFE